MENFKITYLSPIGQILIEGNQDFIQKIIFEENAENTPNCPDILWQAKQEIEEYFLGQRSDFSFPFKAQGTDFQQVVWKELTKIPYGQTISYKKFAQNLGDEKLIRAAASANGKNPLSIVVPCHRVIGANGKLVGYAGGLWRKQFLLELENKKYNLF